MVRWALTVPHAQKGRGQARIQVQVPPPILQPDYTTLLGKFPTASFMLNYIKIKVNHIQIFSVSNVLLTSFPYLNYGDVA